MSEARPGSGPLDLVLDFGKTRAKLMVLTTEGRVIISRDTASVAVPMHGYLALDTKAVEAWLEREIINLGPLRDRLAHAVVTAHGAAFALVDEGGLVLPVPDYEFGGFDDRPDDWSMQVGEFAETLSPSLPAGLNGAAQLEWLERQFPNEFARGTLMPYAQYWSWWLSGVASSEVSSLGCHTHLWSPTANDFSALAKRRGWSSRFAPLRRAWEVLGPVRSALADRLNLPPTLRIHCGVHDSNACLARYLRASPRLTLVSTGTWIVVMAPGASACQLDAERDLLGNVSIRQQVVPTGRFMGGREVERICGGADPGLANERDLEKLLARGIMLLPAFEPQGGPFREQAGQLVSSDEPLDLTALTASERATAAACYAAQVTAWIVDRLNGVGPVVVEGPFAKNLVYVCVLAALLPNLGVLVSIDELEGTARGAWQLAHWTEPSVTETYTVPAAAMDSAALQAMHERWLAALSSDAPCC